MWICVITYFLDQCGECRHRLARLGREQTTISLSRSLARRSQLSTQGTFRGAWENSTEIRKTDTATSKLSSIEAAQSFSLIFPHLLMRILVNLVREWVEIWGKWRAADCKSQVGPRSPEEGEGGCSDHQSLSGLITGPRRLLTTVSRHANMAS